MEKQAAPPKPNSSSKKVMAKFLPKVLITSGVAFDHHNHHHHYHHHHHHETSDNKVRVVYPATSAGRRAFSGPLVSMIPPEARRETKNGTSFLDSREPTSPKVSCMGQLVMKPRKNKMEKKGRSRRKLPTDNNNSNKILTAQLSTRPTTFEKNKNEEVAASTLSNKRSSSMKLSAMIRRMLPNGRKSSAAGRSAAEEIEIETVPTRSRGRDPPALCHMKRFSSGRDALATFDWWSATNKLCDRSRNHYSYDDEDVLEGCSDDGGEYEHYDDQEDYKIPFSAPIGGEVMELEQRKEINLWKRRTMAPPRPLELMKI